MEAPVFEFQPRWKEELVCSAPMGSFVLEMTMGVLSVYFPTEAAWTKKAPAWAQPYWAETRAQLETWCNEQRIPLYLDDGAGLYPLLETDG